MEGRTAEEEAKIKAEARAYALSGTTNEGSARQRRNGSNTVGRMATTTTNPTTSTTRKNKRTNPNTTRVDSQLNSVEELGWTGRSATVAKKRTAASTNTATAASTSMSISRPTTSVGRPSSSKKARTNLQQIQSPIGLPSTTKSLSTSSSAVAANLSMATITTKTTTPNQKTHKIGTAAVSPTPTIRTAAAAAAATTTSTSGVGQVSTNSNYSKNDNNNNNYNNHHIPIVFDDDDNDYVKMIKSLGLDDFHIFEKLVVENEKDDDDDEEYDFQLSDLDDDDPYLFDNDDDEEEEDDDNDNDDDENDEAPVEGEDTRHGSTDTAIGDGSVTADPTTTTASTTSTAAAATTSTPNLASSLSADGGSPATSLPDLESEGAFYRDLEEELGSLLEEDMEAAVQSLYINHHHNHNINNNAPNTENDYGTMDGSGSSTIDHHLHPHHHRLNSSGTVTGMRRTMSSSTNVMRSPPTSTQHLIAHTNTSIGSDQTGPVTAATIAAANRKEIEAAAAAAAAAESKNNESRNASSKLDLSNQPLSDNNEDSAVVLETPLRDAARQGPRAQVSYRQAQQLRKLLQEHYQLLIQQAIMSIRAAQWQKMGFLASVVNPPANSTTLSVTETRNVTNSGSHDNSSVSATLPGDTTTRTGGIKVQAKSDFLCGESADDLVEILDGAVGMLQDLDQNRKDAIRTSIQLAMAGGGGGRATVGDGSTAKRRHRSIEDEGTDNNHEDADDDTSGSLKGRRSLLSQFSEDHDRLVDLQKKGNQDDRRLTRAAFQLLQAQPIAGSKRTAFDIPGLLKLKETFNSIDRSVNDSTGIEPGPQEGMGRASTKHDGDAFSVNGGAGTARNQSTNILQATTHAEACRSLLKQAGAHVDESLLPGVNDLSDNFSRVQEYLDDSFQPPCNEQQLQFLRKNRNLFTSGEDNLVLRGVNLYGEKQWILIADRYLPDRSVNIISQRYSKLCVMLYKANGIHIDSKGNLLEPPKLESVDDIDESRVQALGLKLVEPPAILNVHRWSLEEDLTLLKAVPIMGHMWAELGARLIPHRDRGHLRKRYQVLERRVKATITRSSRKEPKSSSYPKQQKVAPPRKTVAPSVSTQRPSYLKGSGSAVALMKNGSTTYGRVGPSSSAASVEKAHSQTITATVAKQHARTSAKIEASKVTKTSKISTRTSTKKVDPQKESIKAPMSIANAAASLAFMKPMKNHTQSNLQSTAAVLNNFRNPTHEQTEMRALDFASKSVAVSSTLTIRGSSSESIKPLLTTQNPALSLSETTPSSTVQAIHPSDAPRPHDRSGPTSFQHPYSSQEQISAQRPPARFWNQNAISELGYDRRQQIDSSPHPRNVQNTSFVGGKDSAGSPPTDGQGIGSFLSTSHTADVESSISPYAANGGVGDASRLAFEKLIDGSSDWSQMSRVRTMMANEDENEAANAIVDYIAKSPYPMSSPTKLPNTFDTSSNMTSLSTLNDVLKQGPILPAYKGTFFSRKQQHKESGLSIMAQVLDRTSDMTQNFSEDTKGKDNIPSVAVRSGHSEAEVANDAPLPLHTPTRPGGFFSTSGTPTGFSLGFPSPTNTLRNGAGGSTYLPIPYSPEHSTFMQEFDEKTQTNGILPEFSAQDDSHKEMEVLGRVGEPYDPNPPTLPDTPAKHSLLIAADDFEAVSALEALSNSPFRPSITVNHETTENVDGKKSLFAKVIGSLKWTNNKNSNTKRESPKKRLDF
jgi:hypothetical protein